MDILVAYFFFPLIIKAVFFFLVINQHWKFPGSLVVRIQRFHCRGPGSILGQGTETLQAEHCGHR